MFLIGIFFIAVLLTGQSVSAVSGGDWKAGRIIDDSVFYDANYMSAEQIQNFLHSKVPNCDVNGTQPSEFGGGTRAQYGLARGYPPPYICLKNYYEHPDTHENNLEGRSIPPGSLSTAQIIQRASQSYGVNPAAIIAILQKESPGPLVTDTWPFHSQYRSAMGYGCPDTAPCDLQYYGLYNQIMNAARQFRLYANSPNSYRYKPYRANDIMYNPNASCGTSPVSIENQSTAGLYNYTPYQPNQAALNNLYGTGDGCSAYGNRNFWRIFNDWFGSTTGPAYQWAIESLVYSGGDNIIPAGQTETLTLRARNNGRVPWYNHGSNVVRLGTWQGPNRVSSLLSSGWISNSRPASLQESVVLPGGVGTFVFQITPTKTGTYIEPYNLVVENSEWMAWPGFSPTIRVVGEYQWTLDSVVYGNGTGLMEPGTSQVITVRARNTGTATWIKSGSTPVRIGVWQNGPTSIASNWIGPQRAAEMNETSVAPGEVAGFQFTVKTPNVGNYYQRFNLVAEGREWMNDEGLTLYLRGGAYSASVDWWSYSTGTIDIPRNTKFTATLRLKNTGEVAWRKSASYPVRIGTAEPLDRGSAFYDSSSWLRDTRPAALVEDVVEPGQSGTFTFIVNTPSTPGRWVEKYRLVAEGVTWFNGRTIDLVVNVK